MFGKKLRLNSLGRYAKKSSLLVMEEHDHCEVPAGCGGVVLRWRNPRAGVPLEIWMYTHGDSGEVALFLDGTAVESSRPLIGYGDHVLSLSISQFPPDKGHIIFVAIYDEEKHTHVHYMPPTRKFYHILSKADSSWKFTRNKPDGDAWQRPDFDDSRWSAMVAIKPGKQDGFAYHLKDMRDLGAEHLSVKAEGNAIWIRKRFTLQEPAAYAGKKEPTGCPPVY